MLNIIKDLLIIKDGFIIIILNLFIHYVLLILNDLNNDFIKNSLSFTPNDCATLWECIEEIYEDNFCEDIVENMSPDEYFKENKLLTLDDCLNYEQFLKQFLIDNKNNKMTLEILNKLKVNKSNKDSKENIITFLRNCNDKEMFPNNF